VLDARRRLLRNRAAMAGIVILTLVALLALLAPLLSPFAYDEVNYDIIACAPNWWPAKRRAAPRPHLWHRCRRPRPVRARSVRSPGVAAVGWWRPWCRC